MRKSTTILDHVTSALLKLGLLTLAVLLFAIEALN